MEKLKVKIKPKTGIVAVTVRIPMQARELLQETSSAFGHSQGTVINQLITRHAPALLEDARAQIAAAESVHPPARPQHAPSARVPDVAEKERQRLKYLLEERERQRLAV